MLSQLQLEKWKKFLWHILRHRQNTESNKSNNASFTPSSLSQVGAVLTTCDKLAAYAVTDQLLFWNLIYLDQSGCIWFRLDISGFVRQTENF